MSTTQNPKGDTKNWKKHLKRIVLITVFGVGFGYGTATMMKSAKSKDRLTHSMHGMTEQWHAFIHVFDSIHEKVAELRRADEENSKLKKENAGLRLKLEANQFECHAKLASQKTKALGSKLKDVTGSILGRTLASFHYQIPAQLNSEQLLTLGVNYFKTRQDEKSASIFSYLIRDEDNPEYQKPSIYLMTAISWYRLEHFELSKHYFLKVLESKDEKANLQYHAQARVWMAMIYERVGRHKDSQSWLKELVDYHPHATESSWVNTFNDPREAARSTASEEHE